MCYLMLKRLITGFNQLNFRERVMVFLAFLTCFVAAIHLWIIEPYVIQSLKLDEKVQEIQRERDMLQTQIAQFSALPTETDKQNEQREIARLTQQLATLNHQLRVPLAQFSQANVVPSALYSILAFGEEVGVTIRSLRSLPVSPFYTEVGDGRATSASQETLVYRHTLAINFTATYQKTYQYLRELSSLTIPFYWHSLTVDVVKYPVAEVTLKIDILSTEATLIHD